MLNLVRPREHATAPAFWPLAGVAFVVAIALSSMRLVAAPGFEFYLGPLFYLLAYRWFGLTAGLTVAAATMAPSILWWGHPVSVLLALGHVLVIHRFARGQQSLASLTFVYQATIGVAAALALVWVHSDTPIEVAAVVSLRKILCEILLAAVADLITLGLIVDPVRGTVRRARQFGLQRSLEAAVSIAVAGATTLFLLGELRHVGDRLAIHEQEVAQAVAERERKEPLRPGQRSTLLLPGARAAMPFVVDRTATIGAAAGRIGCARTDAGQAGPDDRDTFAYWLTMCYVVPAGPGLSAAVAPQPHVLALFGDVLRGVTPMMIFLVIAELGLLAFGRAIRRSMRLWEAALRGFGARETLALPHAPFHETDALLRAFVSTNNEYVVAEQERQRLSRAVDELRSTIELKLFNDVGFDPATCALHFVKIDPITGERGLSFPVHGADAGQFAASAGKHDVMIEFRRGDSGDDQWYLLLAHEYDEARGHWRYGCLIRLRTAKAFQSRMRHNARLMELGGMASALSHELRQPLFTISLAAENGSLMLDPSDPSAAKVAAKFERIIEQVERASSIVQRTSSYARLERDEREPTNLVQATHDAIRFMRPVMTERSIHLRTKLPAHVPMLLLPRIGIEQIVVNALQNAADSIDAARECGRADAGRIAIALWQAADAMTVTITDDGAGINDAVGPRAFDAFCTSKPAGKGTGLGLFVCRQIMDEVGGSIALTANDGRPGATLTLRFLIAEEPGR
ncbi:ATP-binding protein [Sphingomonas baiyangensis]|uniref:histidine kinase n=1 Tax=Sphingomonas baiyangensis TaxID=2572576 RepID=A0A4U1L4B0_9SPHN|nr:ATP-binding protein [Sphingomonas baiyangensis]TKD51592.1 hypothetical protein FBR43_13125 [Sphingomonas baiyangensis]